MAMSRQEARRSKHKIMSALSALKSGDQGPADRLTEGLNRRDFIVTIVAATAIPALPAPPPPARLVLEATGAVYWTDGRRLPAALGGDTWTIATGDKARYAVELASRVNKGGE